MLHIKPIVRVFGYKRPRATYMWSMYDSLIKAPTRIEIISTRKLFQIIIFYFLQQNYI